ncbi:Hvo_1808 family surface protein [Saliphagus infecundisoli]|uniref:Hvo_1808 family surface protein n=1 Tax=Saliphagus infecundisoli TaxID=1849069 RepID=A0ABD5QBT2_9EURY|nr:Hvo_1808 family surface protein [Saliphagus infecundisoli]
MSARSTRLVVALLLAAVVGAGVAAAGTAVTAQEEAENETDELVADCAAEMPADYADPAEGNDTVGWVGGYWYDEPLDIEREDGLNETELDALSARAAARFEALRCLTFEELPEIDVVSREEFESENAFANVTEDERAFDNAMLETMLLVGNETDSIDVREEERAAVVAGYYDFVEERIVVVSEDPGSVEIDEGVLAHELGHALQDQQFDLDSYERPTTDVDNGVLGMIEGDAQRIEYQYSERCEAGRWAEPCLSENATAQGAAAGEPPSWGLYFMGYQPYSDGPSFVEHVYDEGGWDAVNGVYEEMPSTSVHTIDPESYGEFTPEDVTVADESGDDWERIERPQGPDYDVIGQAGLSAMLMDPAYDGSPIIPPEEFLNMEGGEANRTDPLEYNHPETDGWVGDRLYAYGDGEETGTVWKLAWEDGEEAAEFADAYEQLIEIRGGEAVEDANRTYEFGAESEFGGAVTLEQEDDRLWIVTAPSVEELGEIHDVADAATDADGENEEPDDADAGGENDTDDEGTADADADDDGADDEASDEGGNGNGNEESEDVDDESTNGSGSVANDSETGNATGDENVSDDADAEAAGETESDGAIDSTAAFAGVGLVLVVLAVAAALFVRRQ